MGSDTKEWRTQKSEHRDKIDQAVAEGLQDLLCESVAYYHSERTRYLTAIEALKSIYSYGILGDVHEKLKDYRSENNTMLMADVTNLLRAIISKDDAPFIFEKVGTTYQHLLVDEFQDTSDFQWLNLLPLVRNSLGTEQNVLVVGDAKQSIYRWRGGNMKLLLNDIREQLLAFFDAQTEQNLANNYRSHARIIEFNNAFFTTAAQTFAEQSGLPDDALHDLRRAYDTVQQGIVKSQGGYVEIAFMEGEDKDTDQSDDPSDTDIATLIGKGTTKTWQQAAANYLLTIIEQAQQDGFAYSDIAILVRGNVEGSQIAQLLAARHIRVISSESLLLNTSPKVQLLLSALHLIADRRNHIARAEPIVNYCQLFPTHSTILIIATTSCAPTTDTTSTNLLRRTKPTSPHPTIALPCSTNSCPKRLVHI
ncbi:MAG: UvrD-helicase domain-containing protein [Sphingobacteriales bacterium]|nr:UvrD-helicase domain-containing protein [Sphingobacteriales bacterium]